MIKLDYTVAHKYGVNKITKKYENRAWLNYENVDVIDRQYLVNTFKGKSLTRAVTVEKDGQLVKENKTTIGFSTLNPSDLNDKNTARIVETYEFLESRGKYEMPSLNQILTDLVACLNDRISDDEKEKINNSTDELWLKFMKEIQKPEIQELLKSIGQYALTDSSFGWQLASSNLIRIKAQKADATFVQTRRQWHDRFDRRVIPNAQKIGVVVPINQKKYKTPEQVREYMKKQGYGDEVSYIDLSTQQKMNVDIGVMAGEGIGFAIAAYYDVSDTVLIDPSKPDKWSEEKGFDNNLTGHLNKAALAYKAANNKYSQDDLSKIYNNEEGNVEILSKALAQGIEKRFPDMNIIIPKNGDKNVFTKFYIDLVEKIADRLIEEKGKIVKKENREQGIAIATTIVLCLTRVSPEIVARKLANNELTQDSYFELRTIINSITWLIRKNVPKMETRKQLNEFDIPVLNSVDELLGMMGMTINDVKPTENSEQQIKSTENEIDNIKENFFRIFNKINKQIL